MTNEKPEIIELIKLTKEGDEIAGEKLFNQYKGLLHGNFIRKNISYEMRNNEGHEEEIKSIMNEIFMNSVRSYVPEKAKFITHLTNMIYFQFRDYLQKDKLIPINQNLKSGEMKKLFDATACVFGDSAEAFINARAAKAKIINFKIGEQSFSMEEKVFISKFILDKAKKILPISDRKIYCYYLELFLAEEKEIKKKAIKKFKISSSRYYNIIEKYAKDIKNSLNLRNVEYA